MPADVEGLDAQPTADQINAAKEAVKAEEVRLAKQIEDVDANIKSGVGFKNLLYAVQSIDSDAAYNGGDDEMNQDADDEDEKKNDGGDPAETAKSTWEQFSDAAKQIRVWAADFVEALKDAPISGDTQKEIIGVCTDYFDLLEKTSLALQDCRHSTDDLSGVMSSILKVFVILEKRVKSDDELTDKETKLISQRLCKLIGDLNQKFQDQKTAETMTALQKEWKAMNKKIVGVKEKVQEDLKAFRKKIGILVGVGCIFLVAVAVVACVATGGAAIFAAVAAFTGSSLAGGAALTVGGIALTGVLVFGVLCLAEPDVLEVLVSMRNTAIQRIQHGLDHISKQAVNVDVMLHEIIKAYKEAKAAAKEAGKPADDIDFEIMFVEKGDTVNLSDLSKAITAANKSLSKLAENIEKTENSIEIEITNYRENIHDKLLAMLDN